VTPPTAILDHSDEALSGAGDGVTSEATDAPVEGADPVPSTEVDGGAVEMTRKLLLIVDDDPSVLQVASKVLNRDGYEILEAAGEPKVSRWQSSTRGRSRCFLRPW
jgi:hypothetical protein